MQTHEFTHEIIPARRNPRGVRYLLSARFANGRDFVAWFEDRPEPDDIIFCLEKARRAVETGAHV